MTIPQLVKLEQPRSCETHTLVQSEQRCAGLAHWAQGTDSLIAVCDECIIDALELLPDEREWIAPALADIRERHLKVGARVRILMGTERGNLGTIYNHLPSRPAPWHVRPDGWRKDAPGIAYKSEELDVML